MFLKLMITTLGMVIAYVSSNTECSVDSSPKLPKYNLIEKCHRSTLGIAAKANFTSLSGCQRLGVQKRALALNFSPEIAFNGTESLEYTCEVLKCAEAKGGSSLTNDTRYDYYSLYGNPIPNVNSTCVPATGMFHLFPTRWNHSRGQVECGNISGALADVTSEQRTEALAQLLTSSGVDAAYVGMWRVGRGVFYGNGETLDCTTYRAWAPGHPRRSSNMTCVVLTRSRMWKTSSCKARFHALCELIPGGPYKKGSLFSTTMQNG